MNRLLVLTLACCLVRLWIMPLGSSLWVDEMGTYFVVHHGAGDPSLRVAPQVAASIYYALPWLAEHVAGFSEVSYRFFSLLAMAGALFAIGRLAARLIHPQAAWFAVFACLTSRGFNYQAADARPYGLGTFILAIAIWLLVRWLDSGRWRDGLWFAAAASLLWWVHLVFWPFYLLFAAYALFRIDSAGWRQVLAIFGLIICADLPAALRALSLLREASVHVVVPRPRVRELTAILKVQALVLTAAGAFVLSRIFKWRVPRAAWVSASSLVLILGWWLIDPVSLFAFSWITGNSIFLARYLYLALPGVALTAAAITAAFVPSQYWKCIALALGIAVLISMGQWKQLWPAHHNSDWRGAAAALRGWAGNSDLPVVSPSPFIEAQPPVWHPNYPLDGFLYSHLDVYSISGHIYPFPFMGVVLSKPPWLVAPPGVKQYAASLAMDTLAPAGRFAIYGGDSSVEFWRRFFAARPELRGWKNEKIGRFGDVEVAVFYCR
jgi:Dolichyl-phosphate-mannose-protein mannosyltransferase